MKTFFALIFSLIALTVSLNPDAESKPSKNFLDQQMALESLIARSEKLNKSDLISTQINLAEHQLQIQALEKLIALSEKLDNVSKKESPKFAFKNLISPSYLIGKIAAGTLHIGGKIYDKSETLIINIITWYILLKLFFPGTLLGIEKVASTGLFVAQKIDTGVIGPLAGSGEPLLGIDLLFSTINSLGHIPQFFDQEMILLEEACALW